MRMTQHASSERSGVDRHFMYASMPHAGRMSECLLRGVLIRTEPCQKVACKGWGALIFRRPFIFSMSMHVVLSACMHLPRFLFFRSPHHSSSFCVSVEPISPISAPCCDASPSLLPCLQTPGRGQYTPTIGGRGEIIWTLSALNRSHISGQWSGLATLPPLIEQWPTSQRRHCQSGESRRDANVHRASSSVRC